MFSGIVNGSVVVVGNKTLCELEGSVLARGSAYGVSVTEVPDPYIYISLYLLYICIYVYVYIYMFIHTHTHTHTHTHSHTHTNRGARWCWRATRSRGAAMLASA